MKVLGDGRGRPGLEVLVPRPAPVARRLLPRLGLDARRA